MNDQLYWIKHTHRIFYIDQKTICEKFYVYAWSNIVGPNPNRSLKSLEGTPEPTPIPIPNPNPYPKPNSKPKTKPITLFITLFPPYSGPYFLPYS